MRTVVWEGRRSDPSPYHDQGPWRPVRHVVWLASISTPDIPLTPVAIAGAPGFSHPGISHCCPLAYPVLKELNEARPNVG